MAHYENSIEVDVPVATAYNQWTQFTEFPKFMDGVESVEQLDDRRLHWTANIGGKEKEWDAVITEQIPDQRIQWRNTSGADNAGTVNFESTAHSTTRVSLSIEYDPEGIIEEIGDKLGFVSRRVDGDLQRFKEFIEARGVESGAWRGEIATAGSDPAQSSAVAQTPIDSQTPIVAQTPMTPAAPTATSEVYTSPTEPSLGVTEPMASGVPGGTFSERAFQRETDETLDPEYDRVVDDVVDLPASGAHSFTSP